MTLAEFIAGQIRKAMADAIGDVKNELTDIAQAGGKAAGHSTIGDLGSVFSILDNMVGTVVNILSFAFPPLEILKSVEDGAGNLGQGFGLGYVLGYAGWQMLQPALLPIQHAVADLAQTEIFDPQTAALLQAKGIISEVYGRSEAAGGNLSGEHYDKLVAAAQQWPDVVQLLTLWNLQAVNEVDVDAAMLRHGIPEHFWGPLKELRRTLLSPADLALAYLRGYMDETTMQGYADQLGVTSDDMQVLTDNTGEPPGPQELMEALRRGFIDQPRFEHGIRQSRIRNEWIDVETRLRFSPMSVSDAVRAVVEHYLTDQEGQDIATQNGLMAEHWRPMVESWGRPLSHEQMMQLYLRGEATADEVKQAFRESDMKDKYSNQAFALARRLVPERAIVSMLDKGVISHDTAMTMLRQQGFNDADSQALIDLGAAERLASHKQLSRTDIVSMYEDHLLSHQSAVDHLVTLGYTHDDAEQLLSLADTKAKAAALKAIIRGIEAAFKAHHLTDHQAISQLQAAGLDHDQAQQLVDEWSQIRGQPTRSLTESQILKLGAEKLITTENCLNRLLALGLVREDAILLMIDKGVIPPPQTAGGGGVLGVGP